ncbi:bifunctional DNA primase/polymerase [Vulcanococcus limneticus]|uniref:bifunctional DNA primase/polymerase n=3 Tax=Vulcanococcus limneticus TaxID=2170428 RepID=UPI000D529959|nr:AAA family ATPase [Vulcanococcus limneticus]MCP9791499.1 AAA family ATPase [Vulcanococcus limneticus MW73D5]
MSDQHKPEFTPEGTPPSGGKQLPPPGTPLDWVRAGVFPEDWTLIPVAGKSTYIKEWGDHKRRRIDSEGLYFEDSRYNGFGVVTGELSGGLIALDIDGPDADRRYRAEAGEGYEAYGEEQTMSWTSGKPGRRQLLYRVPEHMVPLMADINTVILREDGEWALGQGDTNRTKKEQAGEEYEELVLRFNRCQSVLPQSIHPDTGKRYRFLNYNGGQPAEAPEWVLEVIRPHLKAKAWLSEEEMGQLEAEAGKTLLPSRQIRGWFFSEEVQSKLLPRLDELVFKHPTFDQYGWDIRPGKSPQMMSGCPWHGGKSGTSFQYSELSGCWDCKACGVGGDVLDFVHKIKTGDKFAGKPKGPALENYVAEIAKELGYRYPDDAQAVVRTEVTARPRLLMTSEGFLKTLSKIIKEHPNPAHAKDLMADLAMRTGRRMSAIDCIRAEQEYSAYVLSQKTNAKPWWEIAKMTFTIPNLMMRPAQIILHAAPGKGKTSAAMGFARMVGRGEPMTIRGIQVPIQAGKVLWIQNDQNPAKLVRDCEDNGIDPEKDSEWFIVKRGFQMNYVADLTKWINEVKPALVVIDSIGSCSTDMQEQEKDKAFASPLYYYSRMNGENPDLGGFNPCTIMWIHHDNAQGEVRGTRYLTAAVDEQWHLRDLTEAEKEKVRAKGKVASNCRFIQVKKSRMGREGDLLMVERDVNGTYSVWDHTPTERRTDEGQGDPEPMTMALRIVRDRARGEGAPEERRMTAPEVWEQLVEERAGLGLESPSKKSVRRWLDRWVEDGVLVLGGIVMVGKARTRTYTTPSTPPRVGWSLECPLSLVAPDPSDSQELTRDTTTDNEGHVLVPRSPQRGTCPPRALTMSLVKIQSWTAI